MPNIKVVTCKPGAEPEIKEIDSGYQALKAEVEGWIEAVGIGPNVTMYLNEEGRINGMPFNRMVTGTDGCIWDIYGPIVVQGCDDMGEPRALTADEAAYWDQVLRDASQVEPENGRDPKVTVTALEFF